MDDEDPDRVIRWGAQLDALPVTAGRHPVNDDEPLSAEQVAGYIAKYATKEPHR